MGRPSNVDGRDTREAIIDAALEVFAGKGFHGASLKDIAALVGIRDSAIYHYFASKEQLVDAILAERSPRSAEDVSTLSDAPVTDARALLERIARAVLDTMRLPQTQKVFRVLMADGLRLHAEQRINLLRYFDGGRLATLMDRMVKQELLRAGHPVLLAIEFTAPFHMLMMLSMLQPNHPVTTDPDAFVRAHVDQFLNGASKNRA